MPTDADPRPRAVPRQSRGIDFGAMPDRRLSRLVGALACREPAVPLADLAAAVADRESSNPTDALVREVAVSLHHDHLPRLDAAGVVRYDPGTRSVTDVRVDRVRSLLAAGD